MNEENEDDKEAYKEEFQEEPVEEEENFEEEGEDQGEGENKEDRMHKIRVEAGKKAIATRKAHIKEQVCCVVLGFIETGCTYYSIIFYFF